MQEDPSRLVSTVASAESPSYTLDASGAGPFQTTPAFNFMGINLLDDPLEAMLFILPEGLIMNVGRTTPFHFAQETIESCIVVHSCCLITSFLFSFFFFFFNFFFFKKKNILLFL